MGGKSLVVCLVSLVPGPYLLSHLEKFLYRATHSLEDLMGLRGSEHIGRCGDDFVSRIHDITLDGTIGVFGAGFF